MSRSALISSEELNKQKNYISLVREMNSGKDRYVYIKTFGCQQNEADSERIYGMAEAMGYKKTDDPALADMILVNTCAVREHAELKALSITGGFKKYKEAKPELILGICGCMVAQEHRKNDIKTKYPYIDILLGATLIHRFPEILYVTLKNGGRSFWIDNEVSVIAEELPIKRSENSASAWVSVMYGCNNFCTYCIVPYVRGRERSREHGVILNEIKQLLSEGVREITLLGQNVNSYGKDIEGEYDFSELLTAICTLDGECVLHFMTSHPKDASKKLIDVMANNPVRKNKIGIACQLHLPLQAGNDRVLAAMNRHYTYDEYMALIDYAKKKMPDISLTTDIIVGFPSETDDEFEDTLKALKRVKYDNIFSFIYSKRKGTPAAEMKDQVDDAVKQERMRRLLDVQNEISREKNEQLVGSVVRVLVEGMSKTDENKLTGRTEQNKIVHFEGDISLKGSYVELKIISAEAHSMLGELIR